MQSLSSDGLSYGVMVTQQILVLSFLVRIQVAQPENRRTFAVLLFFVFKVLKVLNDLKDFKELLLPMPENKTTDSFSRIGCW